jgi:Family of unknown function (DUF6200)
MSSVIPASSEIHPVVVDLGKTKKKDLKALKRGEGKLMADVHNVMTEIRANNSELAGKELVPVIILYRKEPKRKVTGLLPFGLGG